MTEWNRGTEEIAVVKLQGDHHRCLKKDGLPIVLMRMRTEFQVETRGLYVQKKRASAEPQLPQTKDAVFMGWQRLKSGEVFALYNVIAAGHASFGSTVTDQGLRKLNLRIPWTPLPLGPVKKF